MSNMKRIALILFSIVAFNSCGKDSVKIEDARKAEAEQRFSAAYQIYSKILVRAAQTPSLPQEKKIKSGKDLQDWIAEYVSVYTKYALNRPSHKDVRESFERLQVIGRN